MGFARANHRVANGSETRTPTEFVVADSSSLQTSDVLSRGFSREVCAVSKAKEVLLLGITAIECLAECQRQSTGGLLIAYLHKSAFQSPAWLLWTCAQVHGWSFAQLRELWLEQWPEGIALCDWIAEENDRLDKMLERFCEPATNSQIKRLVNELKAKKRSNAR